MGPMGRRLPVAGWTLCSVLSCNDTEPENLRASLVESKMCGDPRVRGYSHDCARETFGACAAVRGIVGPSACADCQGGTTGERDL